MAHDWLLVETLGMQTPDGEPVVVAQGDQLKNLVPLGVFLRRNPAVDVFRKAVADTIAGGVAVRRRTSADRRVVHTEPVVMSDGRVHGVHIWVGPTDARPPQRPIPGPLLWDLTTGLATDTAQSLANSGMDPDVERTHGRTFAQDMPTRALQADETEVLALAVNNRPGRTYCNTWDVPDRDGAIITVGFVVRTALERAADGTEHLIARAMNWRSSRPGPVTPQDTLAQRILDSLARPGTYRALVDINTWTLLRWLDEPCPLYDWQSRSDTRWVHPDDAPLLAAMTAELDSGVTERVLRLPGLDTEWVALHVTVHRVQLEPGIFAGMITMRAPTATELARSSF